MLYDLHKGDPCLFLAILLLELKMGQLKAPNGEIEIECVIEKSTHLIPIEIKSGETANPHFFNSLLKWNAIAERSAEHNYVIYGGNMALTASYGNLVPWHESGSLVERWH